MADTTTATTTFQANGKKHELAVVLRYAPYVSGKNSEEIALVNENINLFEYTNKLNGLMMTGRIVYDDNRGQLGKIFSFPTVFCHFVYHMLDQSKVGDVGKEDVIKGTDVSHTFLVDNMRILSRNGNIVKYEIKLVSSFWFNFTRHVSYTTYPAEKPVTKIVEDIFSDAGLPINKKTFDDLKSSTSIQYISGGTETPISAFSYLMKRSFYIYENRDKSLKFVVYDEQKNEFRLFDLFSDGYYLGHFPIVINPSKSALEGLFQASDVEMRSVVKGGNTDGLFSMAPRRFFTYDIGPGASGEIKQFDVKAEDITQFIDNKSPDNQFPQRYDPIMKAPTYLRTGSEWGNDEDMYAEMVNTFMNVDALIVNIDGDPRHKPASVFTLELRDKDNAIEGEEVSSLKDQKTRYMQLRGTWISTSVRHIIVPRDDVLGGKVRSNVCLSRNFVNKEEDK
jgi:hypothetical protein